LAPAAVLVVVVPALGCCWEALGAAASAAFTPGFDLDAFFLRLAPLLESKPVLPMPMPC